MAFVMPTIQRHARQKPNHSGKIIVPWLKNWTEVNERLAPNTTSPEIKNSPTSFVFGESRAKSSRNPKIKIPIDPRKIAPITGF